MTMRTVFLCLMATAILTSCGPDPDELVRNENRKLADMASAEASKAEGVMARIRYDAELIAKGETPQSTLTADSVMDLTTTPVSEVEPATSAAIEPEPVPSTVPVATGTFSVQVGAFTDMASARRAAETWVARGYANTLAMENPRATTLYRYVVRIPGFSGYRATVSEAEKINREYGIRAFPVATD